jgi:hypothetical protein
MTKEIQSVTPSQAGLSLVVCSGPRGNVQADWPNIEYTVELQNERRTPIWTGPYRLGVGHVSPAKYQQRIYQPNSPTADEENLIRTWQHKPHAQFTNKQLWADAAAKLAKIQRVSPKLDDVCHSLLFDGAAFFDGQRFEDWAAEYGDNPDSIKAKATFDACDATGRALSRHLSRDQLAGLRAWAQNY